MRKLIGIFATAILCIVLGLSVEWGRELGISLSLI